MGKEEAMVPLLKPLMERKGKTREVLVRLVVQDLQVSHRSIISALQATVTSRVLSSQTAVVKLT